MSLLSNEDSFGGDEVKLLQIFPEEIWHLILGHVKEAEPYHNISSAFPRFRPLLLPRAPEILFPSVARLVLNAHQKIVLNRGNDPYDPGILATSQLPFRSVCRSWREGVDQVLQTQHFNPDFPVISTQFNDLFTACLYAHFERFDTDEDFSRFEENFQSTHPHQHQNPFLCRAVVFSVMDKPLYLLGRHFHLDQYYLACVSLLKKYGHHIWYCAFKIDLEELQSPDHDQIDFYHNLQQILRLMPNLRALKIDVIFPVKSLALNAQLESVDSFPTLGQLRYLEFSGVPCPIVQAIVDTNPQVTQVEASRERLEGNAMKAYLERLPNLREVSIYVADALLFQTFSTCQVNNSLVKKMNLVVGYTADHDIAWNAIFTALERHFSDHLIQLSLSLPGFQSEDIRKCGGERRLMLPKLKVLHLRVAEVVSLDYVLPMAGSLEELTVQECTYREYNRNRDIKINEQILKVTPIWKEPQKSNLWTLLPKLKLLKTLIVGEALENPVWVSGTRTQWTAAAAAAQENNYLKF